jgi:predicted anti-sigma-YlaC factor YlaD
MKCHRAKNFIFDFLDGVLTDSDRIALEEHLNACKACEAMPPAPCGAR